MIDLYLRSLLLAAIGFLALLVCRRCSASVRHCLVVTVLGAILALPILDRGLPRLAIPILPRAAEGLTTAETMVGVGSVVSSAPQTALPVVEEPQILSLELIWSLGSVALMSRWVVGWLWLFVRLRRAVRVEGLPCSIPVFESNLIGIPCVAWLGQAAIVLPEAWREWPKERLDVVLRHEMAHVRQGDGWSLLVARLACIVAWANPLVWLLATLEARLAEQAADDLVVLEGVPNWLYAQELLAIAHGKPIERVSPALNMARKAEVSKRVEMILKPEIRRNLVARRMRWTIVAVALLVGIPVASWAFVPQQASVPSVHQTAKKATVHPRVAQPKPRAPQAKVARIKPTKAAASKIKPKLARPAPVAPIPKVVLPAKAAPMPVPVRPRTAPVAPLAPISASSPVEAPVEATYGDPVQIMVKCKFVKNDDPGKDPFARSASEPTFKNPDTTRIVSQPSIRTLSGQQAWVTVTIPGEAVGTEILPVLAKDGTYRVNVRGFSQPEVLSSTRESSRDFPPNRKTTFQGFAILRAGEWLRCQLPDATGKFRGYHLLLQLSPINEP